MDFVSVDVETANADIASICQIGIVGFEDGNVKESWQTLVNPEDYFDPFNISIHGIDNQAVREAPIFPDIYDHVKEWLTTSVVASHTPFDRVAVERVAQKYGLEPLGGAWLDTARVARRAWPQFARNGYGLSNVAAYLESLSLHIVRRKMRGRPGNCWFERCERPAWRYTSGVSG